MKEGNGPDVFGRRENRKLYDYGMPLRIFTEASDIRIIEVAEKISKFA